MTTRVQIPAYTDRWMMGDRYGEVTKVIRAWEHHPSTNGLSVAKRTGHEIASVKLDKSGKTVRVILADCVEV
jgi:hypothetical protein